ncbi:autophagy protein 5 [Cryptococcus sp. DSM 104549]
MTNNPVQSSSNLFRRLAWQSSVPVSIRLADGEPGAGSVCDRYFIQAPRYSYLPLLIPEIKESLVELALDDAQLEQTDEKDWWFEEEVPSDSEPGGFAPQGACRWHWPIDLLDLYSFISRPQPLPASSLAPTAPRQLNLLLHLSSPPQDRLLMPNSIDTCKSQWLNQVKEADFVRWRNTSRVTSLRRGDLEAGWDGIVQDDFDLYFRMAAKIIPLPIPAPASTSAPGSRPPSTDPGGRAPESSYATRAVPLKIYLPDNAPVVQEVVPPLGPNGTPTTLLAVLRQHLPLLFPPSSRNPCALAFPIAQGVPIPPEAEIGWLASCVCGADGWVRVGICLRLQ